MSRRLSTFVGAVARLGAERKAWSLSKVDLELAEAARLRRWLLRDGSTDRVHAWTADGRVMTAAMWRQHGGRFAARRLKAEEASLWHVGQTFGWRAAFAVVGAGGGLLILLLRWLVPAVQADEGASPARELSAFASVQVWLTLGVATIGFGGMFAVYSYITPTLIESAGIAPSRVPLFLALWGLGMVFGNVLGGWLADRALVPAIIGIIIWNIVFLAAFSGAAHAPLPAAASLFMVGIGFALVPALQARLMDVARHAQSLAAAMNHSAFNLSNAIGAWTGGMAIAAGWGGHRPELSGPGWPPRASW